MTDEVWICPQCKEELGLYNGYCEYCEKGDNVRVYNPDMYYIREIRIEHITRGDKTVTPQEELFAQLFNHEKVLVKDMDTLELRAHRETLAKIAFEARARLTAVDDEESNRKKKSSIEGKPTGFERSVNTDETTTNAINTIKSRSKRLTQQEKIQAGLEKLGISTADAEKLMSAGVIKARVNNKTEEEKKSLEYRPDLPPTPVFNPFAKK